MKLAIVTCALLVALTYADNNEKKLLKHLFSDYDEYDLMVRPVKSDNDTVVVKVGLTLTDIVEIEDDHNTLKIAGWLQQSWHDPKLQWDPEEFGGIAEVAFPNRRSWTPDVKLFNRLNLADDIFKDEMKIVFSDGTLIWVPRGKLKIKCRSSLKHRGQLACKFTVGSWVYNQNQIDLAFFDKADIDMTNYQPDAAWNIVKTSAEKEVKHIPGAPDPYVMIHFNLVLQHRPRNEIPILEEEWEWQMADKAAAPEMHMVETGNEGPLYEAEETMKKTEENKAENLI